MTRLSHTGRLTVTPWDMQVRGGDDTCPAGTVEVRDLARGLAGALFVSLPLLFTQEMWQAARDIPTPVLLAFLGISLVVNRCYLEFAGFRRRARDSANWWDVMVAMGIGMFASVITLFVTGTLTPALDIYLTVKLIALETIPMSMGAAVAVNQLGGGDRAQRGTTPFGLDAEVLLGAFLGGFLFAFNIAPTQEPRQIVQQQDWWMVLATALISLAIAYLTVAIAQFDERDLKDRKIITSEWLEALVAYIVAVLLSMVMLWVFGFGTPFDPYEVWLPQTVALAYATTLGGAGGRLIL